MKKTIEIFIFIQLIFAILILSAYYINGDFNLLIKIALLSMNVVWILQLIMLVVIEIKYNKEEKNQTPH